MPGTTRKTTEPTEAQKEAQKERDGLLRSAYTEATAALRARHQDEFNSLYKAAAWDKGVEWTPRPNPEQKAAEQIQALLAEFPNLKGQFSDQTTVLPSDDGSPDPLV